MTAVNKFVSAASKKIGKNKGNYALNASKNADNLVNFNLLLLKAPPKGGIITQ